MFERYTEKARRVVFFARYEASHYGSPYIDTEHLLLGLLREDRNLFRRFLPAADPEAIRREIEIQSRDNAKENISANIDLPLSNEAKRVLEFASDEALTLKHLHIGTEHLLLALLREKETAAAKLLHASGANLTELQRQVSEMPGELWMPRTKYPLPRQPSLSDAIETVEIHGSRWNRDFIREAVKRCRGYQWYWQRKQWKPRDIVLHRSGAVSFDLSLAEDTQNFKLIHDGWKRDYCAICHWAIFESEDPAHGIGYTNGLLWVCTECYTRFLERPGFFSSAYSDMT